MKFTVQTQHFREALKVVSVAAVGLRSIPILGNVKIEALGEELILSATNLDIYVIRKVPAKIQKEGATTIPLDILSQLVNQMRATTVSLTEEGKNFAVFESGEVTASLETLPAWEFPPPRQSKAEAIICEASDITKPFTLLEHSMSDDTQRYNLMGVHVDPEGNFVATNSRTMSLYSGAKITNEDAILVDQFVRAVIQIKPEGEARVQIGDGYVIFSAKDVEIQAKLVEGRFPAWKAVFPEPYTEALSCGRDDLIRALQTCSIFINRKLPRVDLSGAGKEVLIEVANKANINLLGTELDGQPQIKIALDAFYLIAALQVLEDADVRLQVRDAHFAVVIEEGKYKEIIMPLRTQ